MTRALTVFVLTTMMLSVATRGKVAAAEPLALAGELPATQLVELVSQRLGVSIQYEPNQLNKRFTLRLREEVDDDELWGVMLATLESVSLTVVELEADGVYKVVPLNQAAVQHQRVDLIDNDSPIQASRSGFIAVLLRPESATPEQLAAAVQPLLTPGAGSAKAVGESGFLLLSDVRRRVESAMALIEELDTPRARRTRSIYVANHDSASRIASSVLAALSAGASKTDTPPALMPTADDARLIIVATEEERLEIESLLAEFDQAPATTTVGYRAERVPPLTLATSLQTVLGTGREALDGVEISVVPDELTGLVYVTASESIHARARDLVESLQIADGAQTPVLTTIRVRNRPAADLQSTIESVLGSVPTVTDEYIDGAMRGERPSPRGDVARREEQDVTVSIDEETNTLLLYGPPLELAKIEALVRELDRRQPQVMIEATIVSLSDGEALDLGVELTTSFRDGDTTINLSSLFGLGAGSGALGMGTGFTGGVLNPGDFEALVRAVESVSDGRTVSTPRVLVNNNATATLSAVSREPFTSINASDTVATTSFGGTEDAGTTIVVTPQIAEGDHLVLEYSAELSAFTGEATTTAGGGVIPPPSQQNSLQGMVTIPDGFTVVVGGLENITDNQSETRTPLLGELPILGALFKTQSESATRARFYVFIRATILRDPLFADLRTVSAPYFGEAGVSSGSPELEPIWLE